MHRARLLVFKAHLNLAHASRELILGKSFLLDLYDLQLAAFIAVVKIQPAADAERLLPRERLSATISNLNISLSISCTRSVCQ